MNRKEFIRNMGAAAGIAALGLGCSKEAEASGTADTNKVAVSAGKMAVGSRIRRQNGRCVLLVEP